MGVDDVSIFHDKLREETYNYTKIINEITVLRQIEETTSKRVKDFYEESPYPKYKFRETAQEYSNLNLDQYITRMVTRQIDNVKIVKKPKILIAGAGTGGPAISFVLR